MNLKPMQGNWATSQVDLGTWSFLPLAVLNFVFIQIWVGVLGESLELPKGSQAACHI